jgi:hypothetical protein
MQWLFSVEFGEVEMDVVEAILAYWKVLSRNSLEGAEENY